METYKKVAGKHESNLRNCYFVDQELQKLGYRRLDESYVFWLKVCLTSRVSVTREAVK
jgi:hypothetical protein